MEAAKRRWERKQKIIRKRQKIAVRSERMIMFCVWIYMLVILPFPARTIIYEE